MQTAFDVSQELLWTGTEGGWVGGFQAPLMDRYMSVHAHTTRVLSLKPLQVHPRPPVPVYKGAVGLSELTGSPLMSVFKRTSLSRLCRFTT